MQSSENSILSIEFQEVVKCEEWEQEELRSSLRNNGFGGKLWLIIKLLE